MTDKIVDLIRRFATMSSRSAEWDFLMAGTGTFSQRRPDRAERGAHHKSGANRVCAGGKANVRMIARRRSRWLPLAFARRQE